MSKQDLRLASGIGTVVMAKLGKGSNLTTDILVRLCAVLDCGYLLKMCVNVF
jgi:DNA-binding Xre family transcriptional regulator